MSVPLRPGMDGWSVTVRRWIGRLPGPRWLAYLWIVGILLAVDLLLRGSGPEGLSPRQQLLAVIEVQFGTVFLAAMDVVDRVAVRSLAQAQPALDLDDEAIAATESALVGTPRRWDGVAFLAGVAVGLYSPLTGAEAYGLDPGASPLLLPVVLVLSCMTTCTLFAFLAHALHQLRIVDRLHRDAARVELFRLAPLYSFATLCATTGILLLVIAALGLIELQAATSGTFALGLADLASLIVLVGVAIACFIVPLLGLHGRIGAEKDRQLAEAQATLDGILLEIRARALRGDHEGVGRLADAVAAANAGVAAVARISTWPWRTETLRGFVSAVILPIALWLIYQALSRVLPG